jgi:DNA-binding SARP family transcriptional activator
MRNRWLMFPQQNRLEIRLLGTFQVVVDGRPAGTGGSKRDALLGLLALRRGRPASVDALIDDLWGSDMPASPRNAVQHHVARLRATLGQDAIVGTPNGYALAAASTDALVFEDLLVEARVALLEARRGELDRLAKRLLEARELERVDIVSVLG